MLSGNKRHHLFAPCPQHADALGAISPSASVNVKDVNVKDVNVQDIHAGERRWLTRVMLGRRSRDGLTKTSVGAAFALAVRRIPSYSSIASFTFCTK